MKKFFSSIILSVFACLLISCSSNEMPVVDSSNDLNTELLTRSAVSVNPTKVETSIAEARVIVDTCDLVVTKTHKYLSLAVKIYQGGACIYESSGHYLVPNNCNLTMVNLIPNKDDCTFTDSSMELGLALTPIAFRIKDIADWYTPTPGDSIVGDTVYLMVDHD